MRSRSSTRSPALTSVPRSPSSPRSAPTWVDSPPPRTSRSWAGMCPGNNESAGKRRSGKTRKGSKWLGAILAESAAANGRSNDTYLGAQHRRLAGRIGYAKANKAVGHSILVAAWHVLSNGVPYEDLGADWFQKRRPEAHVRRLARQIEALGYRVAIEPLTAA